MKRELKTLRNIATSSLRLSALSSANGSLGGTNLVGGLANGYGSMLPAVGSITGASMVIHSARRLRNGKKRS